MATITFTLNDFGLETLTSKSPVVRFIPSGAGVAGTRLFASTPVQAKLNQFGAGSVVLAPTDGVMPNVWYTVQIEHLQPGGQYTHHDILNLRIFVPDDYYGPITGLPGAPLSPQTVLVSLDPPPPGYKGWWLYSPAQGQEMPLDDPLIGELRMVS